MGPSHIFKCRFYLIYNSEFRLQLTSCLLHLHSWFINKLFNEFRLQLIYLQHLSKLLFVQDTHLLATGGLEKILRIFDLNRPDALPREVGNSPGSIRTVAWLHSDQTILSSCTDTSGVRYDFVQLI